MKIIEKNIDVYDCSVIIAVTDDFDAFVRQEKLEDYCLSGDNETLNEYNGLTFRRDINTYCVLFKPDYLTINTIAHEAFHLAKYIGDDRELYDYRRDTGLEPLAYLLGFIAQTIYDETCEE
ncbi:MAG: hypothetical protein LBE91_08290 [Tannerella sp.]|jgi:hypothetical protein|nr:hypothetical protein [Tannerella sp.]